MKLSIKANINENNIKIEKFDEFKTSVAYIPFKVDEQHYNYEYDFDGVNLLFKARVTKINQC